MSGAERLERAIRDAGRPALAAFVTGGYPSPEAFARALPAVASEAEIVEVGVPFSDPMADGLTIQDSSRIALEHGVTLTSLLEVVEQTRLSAPVVLMSYLNPLLRFGIERLASRARAAGVSGFIVPDLPFEECGPLKAAFDAEGLALVQLVTPVTPPSRLARLCAASTGFVYAVTVTGVTGGANADVVHAEYLARVRDTATVPVLAGFGIRRAEQLAAIADIVDGGIVGSALVEALGRGEDPAEFLRGLRTPPGRRR